MASVQTSVIDDTNWKFLYGNCDESSRNFHRARCNILCFFLWLLFENAILQLEWTPTSPTRSIPSYIVSFRAIGTFFSVVSSYFFFLLLFIKNVPFLRNAVNMEDEDFEESMRKVNLIGINGETACRRKSRMAKSAPNYSKFSFVIGMGKINNFDDFRVIWRTLEFVNVVTVVVFYNTEAV